MVNIKSRKLKEYSAPVQIYRLNCRGEWIHDPSLTWELLEDTFKEEIIDENYNFCGIKLFVSSLDEVIIYRGIKPKQESE